MTTYATMTITYLFEDMELLKKRHLESEFGQEYLEEVENGEHEFAASSAILDLIHEGVSLVEFLDMGVEFQSSVCHPNTDDATQTAINGELIF